MHATGLNPRGERNQKPSRATDQTLSLPWRPRAGPWALLQQPLEVLHGAAGAHSRHTQRGGTSLTRSPIPRQRLRGRPTPPAIGESGAWGRRVPRARPRSARVPDMKANSPMYSMMHRPRPSVPPGDRAVRPAGPGWRPSRPPPPCQGGPRPRATAATTHGTRVKMSRRGRGPGPTRKEVGWWR